MTVYPPVKLGSAPRFLKRNSLSKAFSLIELLTVIGFMSLMLVMTVPAVSSLKGTGDFTRSVDSVELTLNRARTYAITQNTYVWVGFYEESASETGVTSAPPPFPGKGKLVLGVMASADGTKIFEDDATPSMMPDDRLFSLERIQKVSGAHMTDVSAPNGTGDGNSFEGRPSAPYEDGDAEGNRISSDSARKTPFPFKSGGYTFYKTIRFSPSGEATINGAPVPKRFGEIGLVPANGDTSKNLAAIQFSGMSGDVRTYRR